MELSVRLSWLAKGHHLRAVEEIEAEAVTVTVDEDLEVDLETGAAVIDLEADRMNDDDAPEVATIEDAAAEVDLTIVEDVAAAVATIDDDDNQEQKYYAYTRFIQKSELVNRLKIIDIPSVRLKVVCCPTHPFILFLLFCVYKPLIYRHETIVNP